LALGHRKMRGKRVVAGGSISQHENPGAPGSGILDLGLPSLAEQGPRDGQPAPMHSSRLACHRRTGSDTGSVPANALASTDPMTLQIGNDVHELCTNWLQNTRKKGPKTRKNDPISRSFALVCGLPGVLLSLFCAPARRHFHELEWNRAVCRPAGQQICTPAGRLFNFHPTLTTNHCRGPRRQVFVAGVANH
jgi:hypothetical protein